MATHKTDSLIKRIIFFLAGLLLLSSIVFSFTAMQAGAPKIFYTNWGSILSLTGYIFGILILAITLTKTKDMSYLRIDGNTLEIKDLGKRHVVPKSDIASVLLKTRLKISQGDPRVFTRLFVSVQKKDGHTIKAGMIHENQNTPLQKSRIKMLMDDLHLFGYPMGGEAKMLDEEIQEKMSGHS